VSSDVLAPRNLLMERRFALAVSFPWCSLLSLFRTSIAAIVVLITRTVVVATITGSLFAWRWPRPAWKAYVVTMVSTRRW